MSLGKKPTNANQEPEKEIWLLGQKNGQIQCDRK